jgi:hypothetical protein
MKKLQMVDLQTQYEFIKDQVDSSVLKFLKEELLLMAPQLKNFKLNLRNI